MLRDFEEIDDTQESRLTRQRRSDIRQPDRVDGIYLDRAFFHTVPGTNSDVGTHPYADTASDLSSTNSIAKSLGKRHEESLHGHKFSFQTISPVVLRHAVQWPR